MNSFQMDPRKDFPGEKFQNEFSFANDHLYANEYFQKNSQEKSTVISSMANQDETNKHEDLLMPIAYKKRVRIKFTQEQLDALEATFQQHHYPTVDMVDDLVERLDLPTQKITVWFQNRRARLKKAQPKVEEEKSIVKEEMIQYDSGIHLEEESSHESSLSPVSQSFLHPHPQPAPMSSCASYFPVETPQSLHQPMWPSFHYSLPMTSYQSTMTNPMMTTPFSYASPEMFSPFVFHDISNYQYQQDFNGDL